MEIYLLMASKKYQLLGSLGLNSAPHRNNQSQVCTSVLFQSGLNLGLSTSSLYSFFSFRFSYKYKIFLLVHELSKFFLSIVTVSHYIFGFNPVKGLSSSFTISSLLFKTSSGVLLYAFIISLYQLLIFLKGTLDLLAIAEGLKLIQRDVYG